jgi:predicted secreted Zn-dependent protease
MNNLPPFIPGLGQLLPILLLGACLSLPNRYQELDDNPVLVSYQTHEYRIRGSTAEDLRRAMNRAGPLDDDGRPWDAVTHWYVSWSYPYVQEDNRCELGPLDVRVEIVRILPRWDPPASASEELIADWNTYLTALEDHEAYHQELGLEAAHEVWLALSAMEAYPTCQTLEQAADVTAQAVLDRYRRREDAYDQETAHGATQGAVFP